MRPHRTERRTRTVTISKRRANPAMLQAHARWAGKVGSIFIAAVGVGWGCGGDEGSDGYVSASAANGASTTGLPVSSTSNGSTGAGGANGANSAGNTGLGIGGSAPTGGTTETPC